MSDFLQKKVGIRLDYDANQRKSRINMEGRDDNIYANLDFISINPKVVNMHNLEIKKNNVKLDMTTPIIYNERSVSSSSSMLGGIKFEGEDKSSFINIVEETARSFGPEWEKAVDKRRKDIIKRNSFDKI